MKHAHLKSTIFDPLVEGDIVELADAHTEARRPARTLTPSAAQPPEALHDYYRSCSKRVRASQGHHLPARQRSLVVQCLVLDRDSLACQRLFISLSKADPNLVPFSHNFHFFFFFKGSRAPQLLPFPPPDAFSD